MNYNEVVGKKDKKDKKDNDCIFSYVKFLTDIETVINSKKYAQKICKILEHKNDSDTTNHQISCKQKLHQTCSAFDVFFSNCEKKGHEYFKFKNLKIFLRTFIDNKKIENIFLKIENNKIKKQQIIELFFAHIDRYIELHNK